MTAPDTAATSVERLAEFATTLRLDDVPAAVVERVRLLTVDAVACALAGHQGGDAAKVAAVAAALGTGDSTVIGENAGASLAGAVMRNAYLISGVNACDMHRSTQAHVLPLVLPTALALAEREHVSGYTLLRAIVAGAEIMTRIGAAFDLDAFAARGWQSPGLIGPFGSAAAGAVVLGLDGPTTAAALGLAGSQAAGTRADWGTPANKFQQWRGAFSGLLATLTASASYSAGTGVLEDTPGGLYATYADGDPAATFDRLGDTWEIENISMRRWPTSGPIQGVVTAIGDATASAGIDPATVTAIRVRVSPGAYRQHGTVTDPVTKFQRLQSIAYVAAVTIADRELWLDQFADERAADDALGRLVQRVEVVGDDAFSGWQAEVAIDHAGGTASARCDVPVGDPARPLRAEDVDAKFTAAAAPFTDRLDVERCRSQLWALDDLDDVADLTGALAGR